MPTTRQTQHLSIVLAGNITHSDGVTGASPTALATQRPPVDALGGAYHQLIGDDVPEALLEFARVDVPDDLPEVLTDPGLLERVIANLVGSAVRHSPPGITPLVTGSLDDRVELRVIDRGSGIRATQLGRVLAPFQRLGDTDNTTSVGLALSRGLTEAMGGMLTPEETPGGGLTMVVSLTSASAPAAQATRGQPWRRERESADGDIDPVWKPS